MAKSVLITGGAKRLGQEMALSLAEKGWAIALHYRNSLEEAESTRKKIEDAGSDSPRTKDLRKRLPQKHLIINALYFNIICLFDVCVLTISIRFGPKFNVM